MTGPAASKPSGRMPCSMCFRPPHPGLDPLVGGDGSGARRAGQTLLEARAQHVDPPVVHPHVDTADGGGCIHVEEGVVLAADRADLGERLCHRGGGVAVHDRDQGRPVLAYRGGDLTRLETPSPTRSRWFARRPRSAPRPRREDGRSARKPAPAPGPPGRAGRPWPPRSRPGRSRPRGTSTGCSVRSTCR